MRSARAKVLHELLGRPLVAYPVGLARDARRARRRRPRAPARGRRGGARGALRRPRASPSSSRPSSAAPATPSCWPRPRSHGFDGLVLVLYGDMPLLRRETLRAAGGDGAPLRCLAMVTATPARPAGYGRIVRDSRGHVSGVVEEKDATPEERALNEINAGIYCGAGALPPRGDGRPRREQRAGRVLPHRHHRAPPRGGSASPPSTPTRATSWASTTASSSPRPRRRCARASPPLMTHATLRDPGVDRRRARTS